MGRDAGGFGQIMFVTWRVLQYQHSEHKSIGTAFGADRLKDQPGEVGPRSGRFMAHQPGEPANQCFVYWDDQSVAVGAWALPACSKNGRTTPATLTAFWAART